MVVLFQHNHAYNSAACVCRFHTQAVSTGCSYAAKTHKLDPCTADTSCHMLKHPRHVENSTSDCGDRTKMTYPWHSTTMHTSHCSNSLQHVQALSQRRRRHISSRETAAMHNAQLKWQHQASLTQPLSGSQTTANCNQVYVLPHPAVFHGTILQHRQQPRLL